MGDDDKSLVLSQTYVFLLVIVSMSLTVTAYHCVVVHWCNHRRRQRSRPAGPGDHVAIQTTDTRLNVITSYNYQNGMMGLEGEEGVCPVCLSEFEEGEELRILSVCVHSFHVACIGMWLYSHSNCPVCRTDVSCSPPGGALGAAMTERGL